MEDQPNAPWSRFLEGPLTELHGRQKQNEARHDVLPAGQDEDSVCEEALRNEGDDGCENGIECEGPGARSELLEVTEVVHVHDVDGDDGGDGVEHANEHEDVDGDPIN